MPGHDVFSAGGVSLSSFRLPSMADDPAVQALGEFGDEFEYTSLTDFTGIWTPRLFTAVDDHYAVLGSSILVQRGQSGAQGGVFTKAITVPANIEIALLQNSITTGIGMQGVGFVDGSGVGRAASIYNDGNAYLWGLSAYHYLTSGPSAARPFNPNDGRPFWIVLRKQGTSYRFRVSGDNLATFTTINTVTDTTAMAAIIWGTFFSNAVTYQVQRLVTGVPDLGRG